MCGTDGGKGTKVSEAMKRGIFILFLIITLFGNQVQALEIEPQNPVRGDVVTIYGKTSPEKEVKVVVSFKKTVGVVEGRYVFDIYGVEIPKGKNLFKVIAENCNDLKVSVRLLNLIWITLGSQAENGRAVVAQGNVPSGKYDISIHGSSDSNSVKLTIIAEGYVKADGSGFYQYSYDTSSVPPGEFVISAEGEGLTVNLMEKLPVVFYPQPSSGGTGGVGGSDTSTTPMENQETSENESSVCQEFNTTSGNQSAFAEQINGTNETNETSLLETENGENTTEVNQVNEIAYTYVTPTSTPTLTPTPTSTSHTTPTPKTSPTPMTTVTNNPTPFRIPGFGWTLWFLAFMILVYLKRR